MYLLGKWRHATFPLVQAKMYSNIKANIIIVIYSFYFTTKQSIHFFFHYTSSLKGPKTKLNFQSHEPSKKQNKCNSFITKLFPYILRLPWDF